MQADPCWEAKRLEIMERDHFRCRQCGVMNITIDVRSGHFQRLDTTMEFPDSQLITLCSDCYSRERRYADEYEKLLRSAPYGDYAPALLYVALAAYSLQDEELEQLENTTVREAAMLLRGCYDVLNKELNDLEMSDLFNRNGSGC